MLEMLFFNHLCINDNTNRPLLSIIKSYGTPPLDSNRTEVEEASSASCIEWIKQEKERDPYVTLAELAKSARPKGSNQTWTDSSHS